MMMASVVTALRQLRENFEQLLPPLSPLLAGENTRTHFDHAWKQIED
jgi:hypothetical protein